MDLIHKMFRIVSPLMSIKFGHDGSVNVENLKTKSTFYGQENLVMTALVNGENLKTKSTFYGSLIPYKHDLHLI